MIATKVTETQDTAPSTVVIEATTDPVAEPELTKTETTTKKAVTRSKKAAPKKTRRRSTKSKTISQNT